ncbi:MAG: U32 family peptidase [Clostridia bacterium]|nr:U32 family peptidase [Clostridia bacterium]
MIQQKRPELLAPAGSPDALLAAISAGADAVYLGASAFSNRMRARNFTEDELTEALKAARYAGAASYITINTRVRPEEMGDVLTLAEHLLKNHCTGFIVADAGIAANIHSRFPEAALHASTQMTLSDPGDGFALAEMGFTRMVVPREISLGEIRRLVQECPLEIEMFLHGAHCVSLSGQCLMSWAMGGRSGNRGECAQPCRLPYTAIRLGDASAANREKWTDRSLTKAPKNTYPLSLKDMCLARWIPEIIDSGVASLKIEGRQKPAAYVYGVTKIYRRLLDEGRAATEEEIAALDEFFSRDGFTDGYFAAGQRRNPYSNMLGVRASLAELSGNSEKAKTEEKYILPTKEITASCRIYADEPMELTLSDTVTGISVTVTGETAQTATGNPLTKESIAKNLCKFGGTPFRLSDNGLTIDVGEGVWCPVSSLNALRRSGVQMLTDALFPDAAVREGAPYAPAVQLPERYGGKRCPTTAQCMFADQVTAGALDYFTRIYLPVGEWYKWRSAGGTGEKVGVSLPAVLFGDTKKTLDALAEADCPFVQIHSPGQLYFAKQAGLAAHGSFRLNLWNPDSALYWYVSGVASLTASPEATIAMLRQMPAGAIVYGHIPLMHTSRCFLWGKCGGIGGRIAGKTCPAEGCLGILTDRTATRFPVLAKDGICEICNALPLWMGDKQDSLPPLTHREFLFTTETAAQVNDVIRAYRNNEKRSGKRLK